MKKEAWSINPGTALGIALATTLAGTLAITGCSDDMTGPDGSAGMVEAYVQDRSQAAASAGQPSAMSADSASVVSGSLDAQARVAISADGETWIDLGPPRSISVSLQASGESAEVHGGLEVPVGTYAYVRLVLENAHANLAAGSTLGPITLDSAVSVTLGSGGQVTIEKTIPAFEVRADTRTRVSWNMNSHLWLGADAADDEEVEEEQVAEAAEPQAEEIPSEESPSEESQ